MGAVRSQLVINDGMTSALRRINKAMSLMLNNFEAVQRASGKSINIANLNATRQELGKANAQLDEMERNYREINNQQDNLNRGLNTGTKNAGGLLSKIKSVATAYLGMKGVTAAVGLSDTMTSNRARLDLIVGDGGSVAELEQKIYASAQRSRSYYVDTMATVSKLGLVAGKAFSGNDEITAFQELVNKNFVVGGASATEQASAMYQLTQAMGSGRLQGDEYRSIIENAPLLAKSIEEYMRNVQGATGSMKEWASEGLLTADIIKAAVFDSAKEVEERFNNMPMTWNQILTMMKNSALIQFQPVLQRINDIANSKDFQIFATNAVVALSGVANILLNILNFVMMVGNFVGENWSLIEPIVWGIVAAFAAYNTALLIHKGYLAGAAIVEGIKAVAAYASAKATLKAAEAAGVNTAALGSEASAAALAAVGLNAETVAQASATAGQTAFNTALWACPITWIIAAVIALIVVFFIFTKQIMGAIYWLGALFKNIGLWIANCGIAAWEVIKNVGLWFANLGLSIWAVIKNIGLWFANLGTAIWNVLKAAASNVGTAFKNAWNSIQIGFWSMLDVIMQGLKKLAEFANRTLGWMGVNIDTSGLDIASKKIEEINNKKDSYTSISDAWEDGFNTFAYDSVSDAWNTNELDWSKVGEGFNTLDTFESGWGSDAYAAGAEVGAKIKDAISFNNLLGGAGNDLGDENVIDPLGYGGTLEGIAGDTSSLAESSEKTTEELEYLRDIAEKEAINRFTTAEVKIDMTGMTNRIDGSLDIDGVVDELTTGFVDALATAAEGVYDNEL